MKIEKTPTRLTIYNAPWKLWLLSTIVLITGLLFIPQCFQTYSLVCTRGETSNSCEMSHFKFSGTANYQIPLNQFKEARIEEHKSHRNRSRTIFLVTETELIEFGFNSTHFYEKPEIVSKINTFLQNSELLSLSIKLKYSNPGFLSFTFLWNAIGLFVLFRGCKITTLTLDKRLGTLRFKRQGLLGTKIIEHPLKDIIKVYEQYSTPFSVFLLLSSFKEIEVYSDIKTEKTMKNGDKVIQVIREFLELKSNSTKKLSLKMSLLMSRYYGRN